MSKYRRYTNIKMNGKVKRALLTWIQHRCKKCQRFLSKDNKIYCKSSSSKRDISRWNKYRIEIRNQVYRFSLSAIRDYIEIPIPNYISNELCEYL